MNMDFLEKILLEKEKEVSGMELENLQPLRVTESFDARVKNHPEHIHVIGEIKRASPSKGIINLNVDSVKQAKDYEKAGVSAISVLTDEVFFKGSIDILREVAEAVSVPVLCKDFIIDEKQLIRARNAGATMVLLIVAALTEEHLKQLLEKAQKLGLEVLVEVHNLAELAIAEKLGVPLIGVNNRNLKTFEVSVGTSIELGKKQTTKAVYISESGFETGEQVEKIAQHYQGILVGETLMKAADSQEKVRELQVMR
ncbi:indole-3-glycerol phosphate synthase TrpC [Enterococcus sp. BWB1-3]|uniref:indole-3-glycerol phosphate synthase TrpC n=1 Tax=Enterococcus sp. BWB1-3 TaxID=2787713 RepID=UPI0019240C02